MLVLLQSPYREWCYCVESLLRKQIFCSNRHSWNLSAHLHEGDNTYAPSRRNIRANHQTWPNNVQEIHIGKIGKPMLDQKVTIFSPTSGAIDLEIIIKHTSREGFQNQQLWQMCRKQNNWWKTMYHHLACGFITRHHTYTEI